MPTAGERIVESCDRWLKDGPLGDKQRADAYRRLISCGFSPALQHGGDIGTVRTSCAIFARAILHDSGVLTAKHPGRAGWPMWGGWLGELSPRHRAWVPYKSGNVPSPGCLFYIEHPRNPLNNHVGLFLEPIQGSNTWRTAEGGGGDGTRCNYGSRAVTLDQGGRHLKGWFVPELIEAPTMPPVLDPDEEDTKPDTPRVIQARTLRLGMSGEDVITWQKQLTADGFPVVPDGKYGMLTAGATVRWQVQRGLKGDGICGPMTRAAIGTAPKSRSPSGMMQAVKR